MKLVRFHFAEIEGVTAAPHIEVTAAEVATTFVTAAAVTAAPMMMTKMARTPDDNIGLCP